mmetsp:Transcript_19457/g.41612  ORF Transcript_19457/g.41612 Transcript_19457/m.41612 type:complete len:300 (+) Transcript_19457:1154-2053(+)
MNSSFVDMDTSGGSLLLPPLLPAAARDASYASSCRLRRCCRYLSFNNTVMACSAATYSMFSKKEGMCLIRRKSTVRSMLRVRRIYSVSKTNIPPSSGNAPPACAIPWLARPELLNASFMESHCLPTRDAAPPRTLWPGLGKFPVACPSSCSLKAGGSASPSRRASSSSILVSLPPNLSNRPSTKRIQSQRRGVRPLASRTKAARGSASANNRMVLALSFRMQAKCKGNSPLVFVQSMAGPDSVGQGSGFGSGVLKMLDGEGERERCRASLSLLNRSSASRSRRIVSGHLPWNTAECRGV